MFLFLAIVLIANSCLSPNQKEYQTMIKLQNHSFANPHEVTPIHLNLNLKANFQSKVLEGFAEWEIKPVNNVHRIQFDTKNLEIITTEVDGEIIDFSKEKDIEIFGSALVIPIQKDSKIVKIFYRTKPESEAIQWLSAEQTKGKPFLYTQSEAILARTWIPCMDLPEIRFTYNATITCPHDLLPLMSATNPQQKSNDSVYHFEMQQPIPSYLMALSIGDLIFAPLGKECGVYATPDMIKQCVTEFEDLEKMIKTAEDLYGKYYWGRYDILVLPSSFPFGGMENPRLTFATPTIITGDKSLVSLIAHELAHSWSGNLVTNRTWEDFWLNEGFTVYFESRIMEHLYGVDFAEMLRKLDSDALKKTVQEMLQSNPNDTKLFLDLSNRDPDEGMSDIAYDKGRFFLQTIEHYVGRPVFDSFLKKYFHTFAFKTINTATFIQYLNENLLDAYPDIKDSIGVNQWVFEPGIPDNFPNIQSKYLNSVDSLIDRLIDGTPINVDMFNNWTTHHFLYFFRNLPFDYYSNHIEIIDSIGQFTQSHNAEIACDWFILCIKSDFVEAQPFIEDFLTKVGRRKFLEPIYEAMLANTKWNDFAKQTFAKAAKGYHAVSYNTIKQMLDSKFGS